MDSVQILGSPRSPYSWPFLGSEEALSVKAQQLSKHFKVSITAAVCPWPWLLCELATEWATKGMWQNALVMSAL
jgi:hypothetical protein